MVKVADLQEIVMCKSLRPHMLEKLAKITDLVDLDDGDLIFKQNDVADYFYMLKRGKVLLEVYIAEFITVVTGAIKPTYSFGWSALTDQPRYTSYAVCAEDCQVLRVPGEQYIELMEDDFEMGYLVMKSVARITRRRLDLRTAEFVKVITKHPEILGLIEDETYPMG